MSDSVQHSAESVRLESTDFGRLLTLSTLYAFINGALDVARGGNERWIISDLEELSEGIDKAVEKVMARVTHSDGTD
jgi:hypothetical protein